MKLKSIQVACFAVSVLLGISHARADEVQKNTGLLASCKRAAKAALKDRRTKVFTAVAAVATVVIIYANRFQLESPESNLIVFSASPQIKKQYPQHGVLVIKNFNQFSASTSVYLRDLRERGILKESSIGEGNTYEVDVWKVLDDIACTEAKLGPFSLLAKDLKGILAPLKKETE